MSDWWGLWGSLLMASSFVLSLIINPLIINLSCCKKIHLLSNTPTTNTVANKTLGIYVTQPLASALNHLWIITKISWTIILSCQGNSFYSFGFIKYLYLEQGHIIVRPPASVNKFGCNENAEHEKIQRVTELSRLHNNNSVSIIPFYCTLWTSPFYNSLIQ